MLHSELELVIWYPEILRQISGKIRNNFSEKAVTQTKGIKGPMDGWA